MVVHFRVAESKEKVPANATDKIHAHLESKGHKTTGGYISFNGLVDVNLADIESVDTILATSYYTVTSLSKEAIHISPPRYIPVNNPFKLSIGGLNEYEGLHETIDKWLYHTYVYNDADRTPRVFDTRMSSDREFFIFTMDSWESTLAVLKDAEAFRAYFANSPLLAEPKLLFELNSGGFGRKSITTTIDSGAGLLNDVITDLKHEVADLRKDHRESDTLVQRQFDNVNKNMENQGNSISIIGNQLHQYGLSLLASRDEKAIEGKIHGIESSLAFELQCMRSADDIGEKAVFKANILSLQNQHRELSLLLGKASEVTLKLMGPAPGSVVPQLQIAAAAPPTQPPAPTTVDQPIPAPATPARTPRASAAKPAQVVVTPAGPVTPSHSTCSQATPTPVNKSNAAAKRAKAGNTAEANAKRLKLNNERHLTTRSESRSSLVTQSGDEFVDLFSDLPVPATSVSNTRDASTTHRISTRADGAQLLVDRKWILNANCCTTMKPAIQPTAVVLTGFGPVVDNLYTKPVCRRSKNTMPFFLTLLLALVTVLCLIETAAAAPSVASSLSLYAVNSNGFVHPMKIDATNRAISHRNPDVFVITETKTNSPRLSKMSYNEYQIFEGHGVPVVGHHLYKWGVVMGIKKGITVSQRIPVSHPALKGRLLAVDIVIPLSNGSGFTHRVIAVYAPWDVGDTCETAAFWTEASRLCLAASNSWTLLGDLNATVTQAERKSGGNDARSHYLNFLRRSNGFDLWTNYPEHSRFTDWTCKPHQSTDGGSIIDRIATSSAGFLDTEIFAADARHDFIQMTDHRAVVGRIVLKPPDRNSAHCMHDTPMPVLIP